MKKIIYTAVFISAIMLLLPLTVLQNPSEAVQTTAVLKSDSPQSAAYAEKFRVYMPETGEILDLSAEDYIFGVVAAEMPALYEAEALKAQAVAAYTFACRRKAENSKKDYDIACDHSLDQGYISESALKEKWGDKAAEYTAKIRSAINEAKGYAVTFNGEPIVAVYHAISAGKTESCKNAWGSDLPYLTAVESECDRLSEGYISTFSLTAAELCKKLSNKISLPSDGNMVFSDISVTPSGTVKEIKICGKAFTGAELREAFSLRSAAFEVSQSGEEITFKTYGYGHGVGMSQNGANYMAKQGNDFKKILTHYYSGCKVEKIKN